MALVEIKKEDINDELEGIILNANNGDLVALNALKKKWHFKSNADVLRFALAVLKQAEKEVVYIDQGGNKVGLTPSDDLVHKKREEANK